MLFHFTRRLLVVAPETKRLGNIPLTKSHKTIDLQWLFPSLPSKVRGNGGVEILKRVFDLRQFLPSWYCSVLDWTGKISIVLKRQCAEHNGGPNCLLWNRDLWPPYHFSLDNYYVMETTATNAEFVIVINLTITPSTLKNLWQSYI